MIETRGTDLSELADLRSKFEDDKKKVEDMRKAKRFKPY